TLMPSGRCATVPRSRRRPPRTARHPPLRVMSICTCPERLHDVHAVRRPSKEGDMKYLCLIYQDETLWPKMSKPEAEKIYGEYYEFTDEIRNSGQYIGGNPLQPTHTATTVRVRNAKVSTTDGPSAETKERLGGYHR